MKTIVRMKFGSHLYGTDTPQSDLDFKSLFIPDARDILLQRVKHTVSTKRSKSDGEKNYAGEVDEEGYALHRYMQLIAEGQTVSLDMLFAHDAAIIERSDCWAEMTANRHRLLTKKSAAFVGYCRTQANKYGIRGSRVAAVRAAAEMFRAAVERLGTTAKVEEIAPELERFVSEQEHSALVPLSAIGRGDARIVMHFECCNKKVPYTVTLKAAHELYSRVFAEYGDRARKAETNVGIDWKALSHAVRVAREALELLGTGRITFPLPYAAHILEIKTGALSYDVVAAEIEELLEQVESASLFSTLPDRPDAQFMDDLISAEYGGEVSRLSSVVERRIVDADSRVRFPGSGPSCQYPTLT